MKVTVSRKTTIVVWAPHQVPDRMTMTADKWISWFRHRLFGGDVFAYVCGAMIESNWPGVIQVHLTNPPYLVHMNVVNQPGSYYATKVSEV